MRDDRTAFSIDGRAFRFGASIDAGMTPGGYVRLDVDGDLSYLGQVIEIEPRIGEAGQPVIAGSGLIRCRANGDDAIKGLAIAFESARVARADVALVRSYLSLMQGRKAGLDIGGLLQGPEGLPATLLASGFGRHTLVCGQSGSGKTYTLGVILERLLLETGLRIVVLDPNSDYVRLREMRDAASTGLEPAAHATLSARYAAATRGLCVFGTGGSETPMQSRYGRLSLAQQALVLDLDPIRDAREYNVFQRIVREIGSTEYSLGDVRQRAARLYDDASRDLAIRIENLGVEDLGIWAPPGAPTLIDRVPPDWRALVFDLGSLPSAGEASMLAASVIAGMWRSRHDRIPTLLVIDEAHNVCPQSPIDRFQAMATDELIAIAGEGRKFGLHLLLVTQRPQKLHVNVMSQCENLVLMRMNSGSDIDHLATVFSHVPASLIRQAAGFSLGQGLAAGQIVPDPMLFKTGTRFSVEGGSDISSTWAAPRDN